MRTTGSVENTQRIRLLSTNSKGCGQYSTEDSRKSEKSVQKLSQQSGFSTKLLMVHYTQFCILRVTKHGFIYVGMSVYKIPGIGLQKPSPAAWKTTSQWESRGMVCVSCGQYFFTRLLIQRYTSEFSKNSMASWPMVSAGTASFNKMEQRVTCLASHWPESRGFHRLTNCQQRFVGHTFSLYLSTCNFYVWDFLKDKVYDTNPHFLGELQANIQSAIESIACTVFPSGVPQRDYSSTKMHRFTGSTFSTSFVRVNVHD